MTSRHSPRPPPNATQQRNKQTNDASTGSDTMDSLDSLGGVVDRFLSSIYPMFYSKRNPKPMLERLEEARMICLDHDQCPDENLTEEIVKSLWGQAAEIAGKLQVPLSEVVLILSKHSFKLTGICHPVERKVVCVMDKYTDLLMREVRKFNSELYTLREVPSLFTLTAFVLAFCGLLWYLELGVGHPYVLFFGLFLAGCQLFHSMRHKVWDFAVSTGGKAGNDGTYDVTMTKDDITVSEGTTTYTEDVREFKTETRKTINLRQRTVETTETEDNKESSD